MNDSISERDVSGPEGAVSDAAEVARLGKTADESRRIFSTLIGNLPGMVYRCRNDSDWSMEFASDGCFGLTGYSSVDFLLKRISYAALIHPDDRESVWSDVQAAVSGKRPFRLFYRIRARDGKTRWVWQHGQGVFAPRGKLQALEGFVLDVSDRKQAEEELQTIRSGLEHLVAERTVDLEISNHQLQQEISERKYIEAALSKSEASYRTLAENLPGIVYRIHIKDNGRIQFFNDMLEQVTGFTDKEIRHIADLNSKVLAEDRARIKKILCAAIGDNQPFEVEYRLTCRKQKLRHLLERGRPIRGADGSPQYIDGVILEITSRKEAEIRLRDSEERFRQLSEATLDGVCIHDSHRVLDCNSTFTRMFEYHLDEVIGMPISEFIVPEHRELQKSMIQSSYDNYFELMGQKKDGSVFHMDVCTRTIPYRGLTARVSVVRDISERKRAENQRLEVAKDQRDTLIREIHHRIKNNLQGVVGLLGQHVADHSELREVMETAVTQINSMAMVYGLRGESTDENIRLDDLILTIIKSVQSLTGTVIAIESCSEKVRSYRISQDESVPVALILNELLVNSVKHQGSGMSPSVRVRRLDDESVDIVIRNAGDLPQEFDVEEGVGLGTGLTLAKSLLHRTGARLKIDCDSRVVTVALSLGAPVIFGSVS